MELSTIVQLATLVSIVGGGFYFTGRVTKTLEVLAEVSADHEDRIRAIEHGE